MMFKLNIRLQGYDVRKEFVRVDEISAVPGKMCVPFDRFIHGWAALVHIHGRRWQPLPSLPRSR